VRVPHSIGGIAEHMPRDYRRVDPRRFAGDRPDQ